MSNSCWPKRRRPTKPREKTRLERALAAKKKLGSEAAFDAQLTLMGTTREAVLAKWTEALTGGSGAQT